MTTRRQFLKGTAAKVCEFCDHNTTLFNEQDHICDVCWEAGGYYNEYQDDYIETEEEAKTQFMKYAKSEWPSLKQERLEKSWNGNI